MSLFPAVGEGIIASLFLGLISRRKPEYRRGFYALLILLQIVSVVVRYGGQEDSSLFFWHPFIVFLISNVSDYAVYRRGLGEGKAIAFEKLLLWPVVIIPIFSAFVLTTGWLIKLYGRNVIRFLLLLKKDF